MSLYSCEVGGLKREITLEDKDLCLSVSAEEKRAKVALAFFCKNSPENLDELIELSKMLARSNRGGLIAMLRQSNLPDEVLKRKAYQKDEFISGTEGLFSSSLEVKDGHLIYHMEPAAVACCGELHIDFGVVTKNRTKVLARMVEGFETDYLIPFIYTIKHKYIDEMEWEEE